LIEHRLPRILLVVLSEQLRDDASDRQSAHKRLSVR
jgi:hypothetical protein